MPWFDDIDPIRPQDTEFVSEGAMRFRELKRALIERLSTAYDGFPDDSTHQAGTPLLFPIASVMVGTDAQRPQVPTRQGHGWYSTDTGRLWIGNRDLQWQQVESGSATGGGPVVAPPPFISGIRLGTANWTSGAPINVTLTEIPLSEPAMRLRYIQMRVFPDDFLANNAIIHGVGSSLPVVHSGGNIPVYKIDGVVSLEDGGNRRYIARITQTPAISAGAELEISWSFWLGGALPIPPVPDDDEYY